MRRASASISSRRHSRARSSKASDHGARALEIFGRRALAPCRPRRSPRAQAAAFAGRRGARCRIRAERRRRCALRRAIAAIKANKISSRRGVDRAEGLVEQNDRLQSWTIEPREQRPLHLPAGQRLQSARFEAESPTASIAVATRASSSPLSARKEPTRRSAPMATKSERKWEKCGRSRRPAADRRRRRPSRRHANPPPSGAISPAKPLSSVDLPAPFGPQTASRSPGAISPET